MSLEEKTRGPTLNIENIGQTAEHQDSVGGQIPAGELFQKICLIYPLALISS